MGYCILCAIPEPMEIKELAELPGAKTGRNSLTLKKLLGGIFREAMRSKIYYVAAIACAPYSTNHYPNPRALIETSSVPSPGRSQEC
jgi:hypothetical protein